RSLALASRRAGAASPARSARGRSALPCGAEARAARPARRYLSGLATAAVVEDRGVAAVPPVLEPEGRVVDLEVLGDELLALLLVPRDDARDGRGIVDRAADAGAQGVPDAEPLPPRRVVDLDLRRPHGEHDARLP